MITLKDIFSPKDIEYAMRSFHKVKYTIPECHVNEWKCDPELEVTFEVIRTTSQLSSKNVTRIGTRAQGKIDFLGPANPKERLKYVENIFIEAKPTYEDKPIPPNMDIRIFCKLCRVRAGASEELKSISSKDGRGMHLVNEQEWSAAVSIDIDVDNLHQTTFIDELTQVTFWDFLVWFHTPNSFPPHPHAQMKLGLHVRHSVDPLPIRSTRTRGPFKADFEYSPINRLADSFKFSFQAVHNEQSCELELVEPASWGLTRYFKAVVNGKKLNQVETKKLIVMDVQAEGDYQSTKDENDNKVTIKFSSELTFPENIDVRSLAPTVNPHDTNPCQIWYILSLNFALRPVGTDGSGEQYAFEFPISVIDSLKFD